MPAAYDSYDYPSYWDGRKYEHESEVVALKSLLDLVPRADVVAEIGAGFGRLTPYYSYRAKKCYLIDPSLRLLKEARSRLSENPKMNFIHSSLEKLPITAKNITFDLIVMVRVMHHIEDIDNAFKVMSKKLSKGGYLILEYANKNHGKAVFTNFVKGDFTYSLDLSTVDKRSDKSKKKNTITFVNHHPDTIKYALENAGFKILEYRSVSNLRFAFIKKHFPLELLVKIEEIIQVPLGKILFGPSIFILAKKTE